MYPLTKHPRPNQEISRVTRPRAEAQARYDRISGWYDWIEGIWETKPKNLALTRLGVEPGETVLEIGVGTGHGLEALAEAVGSSGQVFGVDLSPRMLALSRARLRKKGLSGRVKLEWGDAVRLNFKEGCFDAIFMSFTLELFDTPDIPQVLGACRRVLRSRGRIGVVSLSQAGKSTWMRRVYGWGHRQFPKFLDCRPIFVQQALEEAGFRTLEAVRMSMWGLPVEIVVAT